MADEVAGTIAAGIPRGKSDPTRASLLFAQVPQFRPLRSDAYEALREAILLGRVRPGERIVEAEIARQMGISRGPIREAVRQLEHEDLVEYHPRRGVVVARLTREAVADTYAVRAELDGFAARLAVARIGDEHLDHLDGLLATMRRLAYDGDNEALLHTDVEFHRFIYTVAHNRVLLRAWAGLGPHAWTLFSGSQLRGYSLSDLAERHLPIVEALRTRDPVTAERTATEHTLEIARNVLDHLDDTMLDLAAGALRMIHPDR
jgi:DNA-binding GntR family transcriptional regulator